MLSVSVAFAALPLLAGAQTYSATYLPNTAPKTSERGQAGTNQCGTDSSQTSMCQNLYINSVDDFCIYGPPNPGPDSVIGNTERIEVAWCLKSGYGTRVMPEGTITGAHFVQTPDYVQVTGVGDLTKINIPDHDEGGELDPHGADGNGNPIGGLVFSSAFGQMQQLHEWTNFVAYNEFCIRGCKDGPHAPALCQHIYDVMGCDWNMPGNYGAGVFEKCSGDTGEPMGVYGASTFHQGDPVTPPAHPAPASSMCTTLSTIGGGVAASATASASVSTSPPSASTNGTGSASASVSGSGSSSGSIRGSAPGSGISLSATRSGSGSAQSASASGSAPTAASASNSHSGSASASPTGASSSGALPSSFASWVSVSAAVIAGVVAQIV